MIRNLVVDTVKINVPLVIPNFATSFVGIVLSLAQPSTT